MPQARAAAKKALELDDTLAEAHASSGRIAGPYDFEFDRSIAEFERAIELNPNYATAHHWLSCITLVGIGQFDCAITEGKLAIELDSFSLIINVNLSEVYFNTLNYVVVIQQSTK